MWPFKNKELINLKKAFNDMTAKINAIDNALAVIEFTPAGIITDVNENFLNIFGYAKQEIVGKHHDIFVDEKTAKSNECRQFWKSMERGNAHSGEFKRIDKHGNYVFLDASYTPISDDRGAVYKVVEYATDITVRKLKEMNYQGQINAINRVRGVIEFDLNGVICDVNDIFLNIVGYSKSEVIGNHHSIFVEKSYADTAEYTNFWRSLAAGNFEQGIFKRKAKNGNKIWLHASYNPVFDSDNKPYKIVKYASDITDSELFKSDMHGQINAVKEIMAVIEFDLKGNIIDVNKNFLDVMGYSKSEIIGHHHSMFVTPEYRVSAEYQSLWPNLAKGNFHKGRFNRVKKDGSKVWLDAFYAPITDGDGVVFKIVKFATDSTSKQEYDLDVKGQLDSIRRALGYIEFDMNGYILKANDNLCRITGYSEKELIGKHHSMLVPVEKSGTVEYREFWDKLKNGEFDSNVYERRGKDGSPVWLQATYNPIMDSNGKPIKVVKFAIDVTLRMLQEKEMANTVSEIERVFINATNGNLKNRIRLDDKTVQVFTLCQTLNTFLDEIQSIVSSVLLATETIHVASNEISAGNADLSQRTETQAFTLETTASSMEQIAATVKNNADHAKQANSMAVEASTVAIDGSNAVKKVIGHMNEISDSSKKIEEITSVIDGIAFQTNILALNAAVEAARAGENGRGFAVVAAEVRNLSQRSASAAKEIKSLILESVTKTVEGAAYVENAGKTIENVVSSVKKVSEIMSEISNASAEQSIGIGQINSAITGMDSSTQQNAALVEQASAAAASLVDQVEKMKNLVSRFK